jgi:steroid delta-isomerase-like uncharacterized protein
MSGAERSAIERILDSNIEALNRHDLQAVLANQHPDARLVVDGQVVSDGHEQLARLTQALWDAFPDGTYRHHRRIIAGDAAATEMTFTGTHTGAFATPAGDLPPTGRQVTLHSASVMSFRDGLIIEEHSYANQVAFLSQLGLMPGASQ